ncbi:MAG: NADH:flavin oxidoreductase [Pseudohongiellaceae bacterium]
MKQQSDSLFRQFQHDKLPLRNRIVMAPMTRHFSPGGVPGENVAKYYGRRASGGTGLIITEGTTVNHAAASSDAAIPNIHAPEALEGWSRVVRAVHDGGAKIAPQLWHVGPIRKPGEGPHPDHPSATPSGLLKPGKRIGEPLSVAGIEEIIRAFVDGAINARRLGFDAVELHGAHGYLLDAFFWEGTNQRTDLYGGDRYRRSRVAADIVRGIRKELGPDFPIILRFSQWKQQDFDARLAHTPAELEEVLAPLVDAGVDLFHCSTRRFFQPEFADSGLNLAGWTRKITGRPAITVGSVGLDEEFVSTYRGGKAVSADLDELLARLGADEFDLVAVGRALLANPDWASRVRSGDTAGLRTFSKEMLGSLY